MMRLVPIALGLTWILPSCAEDAGGGGPLDVSPAPSPIPEVPADAGCEAGTEGCEPALSDCATRGLEFCPVAIPDTRPSFTSVWGSRANDVWVGGTRGALLHFDGAAWSQTPSGTTHTIFKIVGRPSGEVWALSSREVVLHSMGFAGNSTWTPFEAVEPRSPGQRELLLLAAWLPPEGGIFVGGGPYWLLPERVEEGQAPTANFWRRNAGATSWTPSMTGKDFFVRGLWSSGADELWAVGGMSTYGRFTPRYGRALRAVPRAGALDWTEYDTQAWDDLHAIWGSSSDDVWAVGDRGTVRRWTNATPKRWAIVDVPTKQHLRAVWGTGPSDVWVVGDEGTILHYDGTKFDHVEAGFLEGVRLPNLRGVWGSSARDVWIVGDNIVLHRNARVEGP